MAENKSASFEASLAKLNEIVNELEAPNVELERAVELYRQGRELIARCEAQLKTAEETLRAAAPGVTDGTPASDGEIPF